MLKRKLIFISIIILCAKLFSIEIPENFSEFVLENGMSVFVYEDFSTPVVRIEYSAKAGIAMQSANNAGYFPLYAALFEDAGKYCSNSRWLLKGLQSECNADSARFTIDCAAFELEAVFEQLGVCAFAPIFNDENLSAKFNAEKERIKQEAFGVESFINGAIDSRVFAQSPWKHDSGIYPALFENKNLTQVRSILMQISQKFYSPQNSALFVSGAVSAQTVLRLAKETFGTYAPHTQNAASEAKTAERAASQRKFVLSDSELSPDITQVVVQYTTLSMEQADIAAVILNNRFSALKKSLTQNAALNIRGDEYINVDAAHKNGSSRLIIQTLLEKTKNSALEQAQIFEQTLKAQIANFSQEEFDFAKAFLCENFENSIATSAQFMNLFSQFWAIDGFSSGALKGSGLQGDAQSLFQRFLMRSQNIMREDYDELRFVLQNENPWLFILVNAKTFSPLAKNFAAAGYQSVTAKNGSWYTQELYSTIKNALDEVQEEPPAKIAVYDENFVEQNRLATQSLANGIKITTRQTNSAQAAILLYIKNLENENGMEKLLAAVLAQNIQKLALEKLQGGHLSRMAYSSSQTDEISAMVITECASCDAAAVLECIGQGLFYLEPLPAEIDSFLAGFRSNQIIKSGALAYQLYCAGVKNFYKSPLHRAQFSTQKEFLPNISYNDVLEAYPKLFDAARLEVFATGNIDAESFGKECQRIFGHLSAAFTEKDNFVAPKENTKKLLKVKLEHTFLTDVSADKAGPRPAVLVPTTDFADPVQYWIKSPAAFENQSAIFDALLLELLELCKENANARIEEKRALIPFGAITIFNVKSISNADALFENALSELKELIYDEAALEQIKSRWIKENYANAFESSQAAKILAKKISAARLGGTALEENAFTQDYQSVALASAQDFMEVFEAYFETGAFKIYSADSKK